MLYYLLFWTILGFIFHFYIIFGTNLLTGGPAQNCCFLPISVFQINRISNGVQTELTFGNVIFSPNVIQETWTLLQGTKEAVTRVGGAPPASWAPRCSSGVLLPPIYTHVPPNYQNRSQKPNSTAATFYIHEIPSWGLFRSSAGRGTSSRRASTSS